MLHLCLCLFTACAVLLAGTSAHPGENHTAELLRRTAFFENLDKRSLSHCAEHLAARGLEKKTRSRRQAKAEALRKRRGLPEGPFLTRRSFDDVLNIEHHSDLLGVEPGVDPDVVFSGNSSCILSPDVTEGPYYVSGELVREDITDGEPGVSMALDIQILDINTCEPVPGIFIDLWSCNATGVYGGVSAGADFGPADAENLDRTMLRGIQLSDPEGVVSFSTIVPGHYTSRTNHIHLLTHLNAQLLPNNTITGGTIPHVGQLFFDQSLLDQVEAMEPYISNAQPKTSNQLDGIMEFEAQVGDPIIEYVYLGETVQDGLFGWIAFGVDLSHEINIVPAVSYASDGGHPLPKERPSDILSTSTTSLAQSETAHLTTKVTHRTKTATHKTKKTTHRTKKPSHETRKTSRSKKDHSTSSTSLLGMTRTLPEKTKTTQEKTRTPPKETRTPPKETRTPFKTTRTSTGETRASTGETRILSEMTRALSEKTRTSSKKTKALSEKTRTPSEKPKALSDKTRAILEMTEFSLEETKTVLSKPEQDTSYKTLHDISEPTYQSTTITPSRSDWDITGPAWHETPRPTPRTTTTVTISPETKESTEIEDPCTELH